MYAVHIVKLYHHGRDDFRCFLEDLTTWVDKSRYIAHYTNQILISWQQNRFQRLNVIFSRQQRIIGNGGVFHRPNWLILLGRIFLHIRSTSTKQTKRKLYFWNNFNQVIGAPQAYKLAVWFICLTAYQLRKGYLMPNFDSFLNVWL